MEFTAVFALAAVAVLFLLGAVVVLLQRLEAGVRALGGGLERVGAGRGSRQHVAVTLDLDRALADVAAAAAALPGVEAAAVRIQLTDGSFVQQSRGVPAGASGLEDVPEPPGQTAWDVVRFTWDRGTSAERNALLAGAVVPVSHDGGRIGALGVWSRSAEGPPAATVEELKALAATAGPVLAAAREHQAIQELVRTDPLTGLLNRRGFDETLAREVARARRAGSPLTLLALDLDNFHAANSVAHVHGDEALRAFARVIAEAVRATDLACRRGGDEFTIILPDTPCIDGLRVDARIRALSSAIDLPHVGRITYSSGVTQLADADDAGAVDERASGLVNRVKREGRDGVHHDLEP